MIPLCIKLYESIKIAGASARLVINGFAPKTCNFIFHTFVNLRVLEGHRSWKMFSFHVRIRIICGYAFSRIKM